MKERKVSRKEMVEQLELSPYGFDLMLIRGTMDIRTLEKISDILTVPMTYWFVENMDILESNKFVMLERVIPDNIRLPGPVQMLAEAFHLLPDGAYFILIL